MAIAHVEGVNRPVETYDVRTIETADLWNALREGWADFMERRGDLIFVGVIYPLIGFVAAFMALRGALVHLLFPALAGVSLLGPAVAVGFYEMARRREQGRDSGWSHFLDVAKRPAFDAIVIVGGLLLVIFVAWMAVAAGLYMWLIGPAPETLGSFLTRVFTTPEGWALIVLGNLAGFAFAAAALAVSVVSMPMLVDKAVDARTAIDTSLRAVAANRAVMLRWGLIVAALLVLGAIPALVGLAVVLPVLGYATWHLYTRLVAR